MTNKDSRFSSGREDSAGERKQTLWRRSPPLYHFVVAAFVGGALVGAISYIQPRSYTSVASFLPVGGDARANRLSNLASQLGVDVGATRPSETPEFFAEYVRSETFRRKLAIRPIALPDGRQTTLLAEWGGSDSSGALPRVVRRLAGALNVSTGTKSGLVRVEVSARTAALAAAVGARVLDLIDEFNVNTRRLTAASDSAFFLERIGASARDLHLAEDSLGSFLEANREYKTSPKLVFAFDRLNQRVQMLRQLESSLSQAREQARIDALRTLPTIIRVEPAEAPLQGDSKGTLLRALFGAAIAVVAVMLIKRSRHSDGR